MVEVKVYVKPDFLEASGISSEEKKKLNADIIDSFFKTLFDGFKPEKMSTANEMSGKFYGVTFEIKSGLELTKLIIREWDWIPEEMYKRFTDE